MIEGCKGLGRKVLIYRIGSLGDTLVALPAIEAAMSHFRQAEFGYLTNAPLGAFDVDGGTLFEGTRWFGRIHRYPASGKSPWSWIRSLFSLLKIRRFHYDTLVYLAPSERTDFQVRRDKMVFRLLGLRNFVGMNAPSKAVTRERPGFTKVRLSEGERLKERLRLSGIAGASGQVQIPITSRDQAAYEAWRQEQGPAGGPWVAFAPGAKAPAKKWPEERFLDVGQKLIQSHGIWPLVLGGPMERELGNRLVSVWGRGTVLPPELSLGAQGLALRDCVAFVGNDTGSMHLAACVGVPCVGIFSARSPYGLWSPAGEGHRILRAAIGCENCGLDVCPIANACLEKIQVQDVLDEVNRVLEDRVYRNVRFANVSEGSSHGP